METKPRNETTHAIPMDWMEGRSSHFDDDVPALQENMSTLMDLLTALRVDLTTGVLPRAARITGTGNRLVAAVDCIDAAIGIARDVMQSQSRPRD
jgi:hypothetical protein